MKQFLHASPLRRLASVALALGFAFWALPAQAILIEDVDSVTLEIGESRTFSFFCEAEEVEKADGSARKSTVTVSANPAGHVAISTMKADGTESADTRISMVAADGSPNYDGSFVLKGTRAGTTTIALTVRQGATQISTVSFAVTVVEAAVNIQFRDEGDNVISTRFVSLGEGDIRTIQVQPSLTYNVTCADANVAQHLEFTPMTGAISLKGVDGLWNGGLVFTDPDGNLDSVTLNVLVTNKPPKLTGSPDPLNPTPWGWTLRTQDTVLLATSFGPSDPAPADYANLKLTWSLSGEEIGVGGAFTNAWMTATEDGAPEVFSVTVSDGNDSYTGYFSITVRDTVTLLTDTTSPLTALTRQGGIAQDTEFFVFSETGARLDWTQIDGRVYKSLASPNEILTLRAVLEPDAYPFGWFSEKNPDAFQTPSLRVPNSAINATVKMPKEGEEGSVTVQYLASYPFYHTTPRDEATDRWHGAVNGLNNVWTDPFGDFDADGLSDTWEDYWFQVNMDTVVTGPGDVTQYPVGMAGGGYGAGDNPDLDADGSPAPDWLPTLVEELAPDGNTKGGWPVVRGDQTNRVFVLKYPLDFSSGGESYYKGDRAEKPAFNNLIEYRGLREDRIGDGTDPLNIVRYAPDLVDKITRYTAEGDNCSGTSPLLLDTDGDGFSDGWEWYFWTTIKYGVHSRNWRCWDPTYTYYSTASAQAGFPMLETDDPLDYAFDVDPTKSYDIDPNEGTYRTYYEVNDGVLKDNDIDPETALPIVPGSVEITFEGSQFALYTFTRALAAEVGVNPKDKDGNDRLFYMLYADTDDDGTPDSVIVNPDSGIPEFRALDGAWVNDLTGQMYVPGWQKLVLLDKAVSFDVTQETVVHVAFERQNGLFPKQFLLSRFDPMNWDEYTASDIPDRASRVGPRAAEFWDPTSDLDGDGVSDVEEYFLGTDPLHWDTDRDGMPDGWEVQRGLLPTDPRSRVNDCGPGDNPDEDYMAWDATGTAKHADAYWADLNNEIYWNGKTFTGYVPGRAVFPPTCGFTMHYEQGLRTVELGVGKAFGGSGFSNLEEFLYSLYGITHGFWPAVYPNTAGEYFDWAGTTTNPCDNDTDEDGIPDGWEPYVGYSPLVPYTKTPDDLMEGIGFNFDPTGYLEQPPVCQGGPGNPDIDFDADPDLLDEFRCLWAHQMWPSNTVKYISGWTWEEDVDHRTRVNPRLEGTEVIVRELAEYSGWYNKWMPTDPWNADTDGDGLTDYQEYIDLADGNGDGKPEANFNPTQADTDLDWLPDGWEYFMGLYSYEQLPNLDAAFIDDEYGPFGDPDGDKLANYQEYLTGANYGWRHDKWYPLDKESMWVPMARTDEETQKWDSMTPWDFPYDPGLYPQYGPTVRAHVYSPVDFFSVPVSGTTIGRGMEALKVLEKRWKYTIAESPSIEMETLAARFQRVYEIIYNYQAGADIPVADGNPERDPTASLFLYDTDPLYDPVYNYDMMPIPGKKYFHHHSREEHDAIVALFENVRSWIYSYAQCGYGWDLSGSLVNGGAYMPLNGNSTGYGFPGTRPKSVDSDNDGMPDYWEIYHGLNPTYGGARLLAKAGDPPNGDRADQDGWGDGSTDNWIMGNDPTYVLNLNFAMRAPYRWPIARKERTGWGRDPDGAWNPYSFDDAITTAFGPDMAGNYIMEWAHYDLVNRPWLSGDKSADADKDGLNNQEEAYSFFANDNWSHTDPSPYWLTDMSQTVGNFGQNASHVNLYYQAADYGAAKIWWWAVPFGGGKAESPQYVWDFETNEGFDTDNDNIGDREEMASVSSRGKTDPQDFDSPVSRKAMYFDGHAACRTQRPFFHDQYALTSHTVEFWVRPHEYPASGRISTLIHRPVLMPVDTLSGAKAWDIRNTFHVYMDELGRVYGQVDNDGIEQAANSAVVMSAGRLVLDKWAHIAVVMDSQKDDLALYINGEFAGHVACSLKPCTGIIMSSSYREWFTSNGGGSNGLSTVSTTSVNFDWSPAPIVVGAYEKNPWGVVGGKLWGKTETQFDENRFFDGWIDEIRIWDRCRSQTQIMNDMTRRYKPADVEKINRARWVWDKDHLYTTDAEADFPQKLLYHYSFDNLPDVRAPRADDRVPPRDDATVFFTDTDPLPLGWDVNASIRPIPFVPWWYLADNRSTVYATDFSYVPFAENTASHLAQRPPRDVSEVVPVYNPVDTTSMAQGNEANNWRFLGYRYRRSTDWAAENQAAIEDGGWQYVDFLYYPTNYMGGQGPTDITYYYQAADSGILPESLLINTMNPYGDGYNTHVRGTYEYNPWNFGGELDRYGVYEGLPIHSDLVPLLDAVADIDVPMWDGKGAGWDNAAIDSDGDGLPDWWEIALGLDPNDASGFNGAYGDRDNDGLDNWAEYLAGTDPFAFDTDSDGYSDYFSRADGTSLTYGELYDDGDGMDNAWEIEHGLDPNRFDANEDLDGDGWTNWEEYMAHAARLAYLAHPGDFDRVLSDADPAVADVYPQPWFNVTFLYDGDRVNDVEGSSAVPYVRTFGEKTAGRNMGGSYDGMYHPFRQQLDFDPPEYKVPVSLGGATVVFDEVWQLDGYPVGGNASITLNVNGSPQPASPKPYDKDPDYGLLMENPNPYGLALLHYATGRILTTGTITFGGQATYTVSGRTFPYTVRGMSRLEQPSPDLLPVGWNQFLGGHNHMVSGWNRFMGWLDLDGDRTWIPGEPMGLSQPRPTEVSWDSVETTIPLTDSVWDFARLKWPDVNPLVQATYGSDVVAYFVNFSWVRGATQSEESETIGGGDSNYPVTGDLDRDGLEDWMEVLAGTATNSVAGDPNDYYSIDPVSGFSYGELYDDGDGIPTVWELKYGLDPYRYDAKGDPDDDGWSNYAEFMAGTDPTVASDYPHPRLSATFYYHGQETDLNCLGVYSYGQKTQGSTWGGSYDGRYTSTKGFTDGVYLGSDGSVTLDKYSDAGAGGTFAVNKLRHGLIESASIDVYVEGADGAMEVRTFTMQQINPGMGLFTQDDLGWILISIESGQVLSTGSYVGKLADVHTTVKTYSFPVTFTDLIRNPEGNHTHMVEGSNRFLGWMDLDGNQAYDQGEPMGLTLYNPTLVGWDSTAFEIPLTDSLWDYPRVSWNDFVPTNFVPTDYIVRFLMQGKTTSGTITTNTTETTTTVGIYGDLDGDGLDAWMEARAGTDLNKADTDGDGRIDFDQVDSGKVLDTAGKATFGELLDDWDGMPAQWEMSFTLDPHLFDADSDLDDDGWSNYAEFMANTDPTDPDDYPRPQFDVTFRYDGEANGSSTLKVLSYSEKRQGTHIVESNPRTIYMGGLYDGLYTTQAKGFGNFADLGRGEIDGKDFGTSSFGGERIGSASLTVNYIAEEGGTATKTTYQLQPYNEDFGVFVDDGEAFILLEYATGLIYSQFNYQVDRSRSEQNADGTVTQISETVQETSYDTSPHYQSRYTIEYSSSTTHYPFTIRGLQAANAAEDTGAYTAHDHMVEGYNRFLGWMDLDNDNQWTPGEPMGLSLYDATLAGWDSVVTEIPLTDELFGFPRIRWDAPTNMPAVTSYRVFITGKGGTVDAGPADGIVVEAPRTFLHEGDYIEAGIRGLSLGSTANGVYNFTVVARDDDNVTAEVVVTNGEFRLNSREVYDTARRSMSAIYPVDGAVLRNPLVELQWKMDWRTEGVFVTIKKDGTAVTGLNNLYVPFPVRHNKVTDDDYYYSFVPQLKDGRSIVALGAGSYTWEVKENLRLSGYTAKTATGSFQISTGQDTTRSVASISGNVHYYGRLASAAGVFDAGKVVILAYKVSDRASSSLNVSGVPAARVTRNGAGAFTIPNLEPGAYGLVGFLDANGNGLPDVGETQGQAFMGGSADPIQLPEWFKPIRIAVKDGTAVPVEDVHIVLRDRDTNGDGVPEIFSGTLAQYRAKAVVTVPATAATNWVSTAVFDPNFKPYSSRTTKTTSTSGGGSETTGGAEWQFAVRAPRTFLHEGDLERVATYGFDLGQANAADFTWEVIATDGYHSETNAGGSFSVFAGTPGSRSAIKPRWPTQKTVVHGSTVKFEWEMDHRNAGVAFKLENAATGEVLIDTVVPFPVMHWDPTVQCYYYTAVPQMEDGLRFVSLPDGTYRYTVTERPNSGAITPQSFTETFQIRNAENTRVTGSIEGDVRYYGRSTVPGSNPPEWASDLHVQAYLVSDAATSSASVGGLLVADEVQNANGAFRLEGLKAGTYSVFAFVDSNGNGIADDWETQGFGFYGGNASPVVIPSSAYPIVVTNGARVVGVNVVLHDRDTDGDLLPDVWEWEQYGDLAAHNGYEAGPSNAYTRLTLPDPSILTNWIWRIDTGTIVTHIVDTPVKDTLRVRVDNPRTFLHEGDFLTPYILKNKWKGERTEGRYEDGSLPGNRIPYLFKEGEQDGVVQWIPYDRPYYGFELGSYSNSVISWSVEAWDGTESMTVTGGSFRVVSAVGDQRRPLIARYPTQSTVLHGETVEFEWQMDDHNAGVEFSLWKIGEYAGESDLAGVKEIAMFPEKERIPVITNMVVAFPIRHGLPGTDLTYYSAVPQLDDGVQGAASWTPDIGKVPIRLPGDGLYEYEIRERPRIGVIPGAFRGAQSFTERFQLDNESEDVRGLYSASGTIRYYGKVMESVELGVTLSVDDDRREQYTAVVPAALADEINPGAVAVYVKDGDDVREAFNDSAADGILYAIGGTNNLAWSGDIEYPSDGEDGSVRVLFSGTQVAGDPVLMAKKFPVPLYLQVYRLADEAETCTSIAGVPVQQIRKDTKGKFEVENLEEGKYAIRAFLDSNGNGYCDDWETQGVAVKTGTVSPNIDAGAAPIVVGGTANNVSGLMIVLHDRDTDNDLLPDSWEWWKAGSLLKSGYDSSSEPGGLLRVQEYADGVLDSDPRTPDTDLDGLTDAMEILVTKTDTHLRDTDGDGIGDLEEFLSGSDPLVADDAIPYTIPALAFAEDGTPYVDIAYPALKPGVVLTYELQRKLTLADEAWETVCDFTAKNDDRTMVLYGEADGVNTHLSPAGTARMLPADLAEDPDLDFSAGFYRIKVYADYGEMVDNGDGTWSYWTWVQDGPKSFVFRYREAARGKGTLVRDAEGNWSFVSDSTGLKGVLVRDENGNWKFQN